MDTDSSTPHPSVSARLESRLAKAKVSASSPKGVVKVVYNGYGDGLSMEIKPGAKPRYCATTMADHVTGALSAADRAVESLHQHALDDDSAASLARWRESKPTAGMDVTRCFRRQD